MYVLNASLLLFANIALLPKGSIEIDTEWLAILTVIGGFFHILGIISSFHAILTARSSEAAIAWAFSLWMLPYVTLPLYWVFGRFKFHGYVDSRRAGDSEINHIAAGLASYIPECGSTLKKEFERFSTLGTLARMPFTRHNDVNLLINGEQTFASIFEAIAQADEYILIQFFIVHDDELGRELLRRLSDRAADGVRIYFLYDEIGCNKLPNRYIRQLRETGIEARPFYTTKGHWNRFQINFRNHRKIVVVDGRTAFVGGLNVGDEYMGRDPKFGPWRDTHVRIEGPAVTCVQLAFIEDWNWAADSVPELNWTPIPCEDGDIDTLVLPTGPADELETCGLFFIHAINSARERLWIASPYFVPDKQVVAALQLAVLRGVDVRIVLPQKPDHLLIYLSAFSFIEETEPAGVHFYRYQPGFMHHKVLLVDDDLAAVGTANLDNRSIRLNFEITIACADRGFCERVAAMFEHDFENCKRATKDDLHDRGFWFRLAVKSSRLLAPIQ